MIAPPAKPVRPIKSEDKLQVIKSDADLNEEIDISSTKVSKVNQAARDANRDRVKRDGMEIIRGDETVEERIASLKGKTDIGSIAERARLKASGAVKMPVVKDDSLGAGFTGKNAVSMNAGQNLPSREMADARKADASALAASRKKEAELKRTSGSTVESEDLGELVGASESGSESTGTTVLEESTSEMDVLRAQNKAMKDQMERLEKMLVAQQGAKPKRGRKPAVAQAGE